MTETLPTEIYGLIGYPVKHSLSPVMHNVAFKHLKKNNAKYGLFKVKPDKLRDFLSGDFKVEFETNEKNTGQKFSVNDLAGFNITIPHKVRALEILEKRFPLDKNRTLIEEDLHYVKISGAINTVKRTNNILQYFNTDAHGFLRALEKDLNFITIDKNVLVFGCGGAGRAVIAALSWKNHKVNNIYIYDVSNVAIVSAKKHFSQFKYIMDKLEFIAQDKIPEIIGDCQLLINASPVGMKEGDNSVIDKRLLHEKLDVFDVIYHRETQLIKDAKSQGLSAINGLNMLLYQGVAALERWLEEKISVGTIEIMREALEKELS